MRYPRPVEDGAAFGASPSSFSAAAAAAPACSSPPRPPRRPVGAAPSTAAADVGESAAAAGREEARDAYSRLFFWRQQQQQRISYGRVLQSIIFHAENRRVLLQFLCFAVALAIVPLSVVLLLPPLLVAHWTHDLGAGAPADAADEEEMRARAAVAARHWAAVAAVIAVNIIALTYVCQAYREEVVDWSLIAEQQEQQEREAAAAAAAAGRGERARGRDGDEAAAAAAAERKREEKPVQETLQNEEEKKRK